MIFRIEVNFTVYLNVKLTDFEVIQSEATLASHCLTDWPHLEHWQMSGSADH